MKTLKYNFDNNDELFFAQGLSQEDLEKLDFFETTVLSRYTNDYNDFDSIKDVEFINDIDDVVFKEKKPSRQRKSSNKQSAKNSNTDTKKRKSVHEGHRERVREKFLNYGLDSFSEFEVLEMLLFYAIPYKDTNELAHALIDKFGSLKGVLDAEYYDIAEVKGIGEYTASLIVMFRELNKYMSTKNYSDISLDTSEKAGEFCQEYFKNHVEESFIIISMDMDRRVKCIDVISSGTENETAFYPRKVMKAVVRSRANYIILAHNHPGSNAEPSANDLYITAIIEKLLHNIGVVVIDHIISTPKKFKSLSDKGLMFKNEHRMF